MTTLRRSALGLIVGGLALALLVGVGIGRVIGPVSTYPATGESAAPDSGAGGGPQVAADGHVHGAVGSGGATGGAPSAGGLEVSASGYTLVPAETVHDKGSATLRFQIVRTTGEPVTSFAIVHDKPMHLFVVRRDFTEYQHVHPEMADDGTWTADVSFAEEGPYRMYADFTAADPSSGAQTAVTLGADLTVPGDYEPADRPAETTTESTVDGYTVRTEGATTVGVASPVLFTVTAAGSGEAAALEPYLGAFGHLVALRSGDMGFVHVHPEPQLDGGAMKFWVTAPSAGVYRLYLDFQVGGTVRTAEFVMVVG